MKLEHVAIWTNELELLKDYYVKFFDGKSNERYRNPKTQLESYFITFESGARLELLYIPDIIIRDNSELNYKGITHLAFEVKTKTEVDSKAEEFRDAGFIILRGPRITGDGYYEFETLDPDGNKIEITTKN